jgi:hypothetical protein
MRAVCFILLLGCECLCVGQIHLPIKRPQAQQKQDQSSNARTVTITGVVNSTEDSSLTVAANDSRFLTFKVVASTKFNDGLAMANMRPGERVRITGTQDDESFLTATAVYLDDTAPPAADNKTAADNGPARPDAPNNTVMKAAKPDPDDEGPPHLKYGKPDEKKTSSSGHAVQYDETPYVPPMLAASSDPGASRGTLRDVSSPDKPLDAKQALIERAREEALNFTGTLPNYVCQQFTTRYMRGPGSNGWQARDVVSATVVFENGKEDYRNIQINGKAISKKMEEMQGSWSTGEFGTTLRSLYNPGRSADFHFSKQTQMNGMTAFVYDYKVSRQNSDWHIQLGSQSIIPAYSGRIWIDSKTARTLRIEMQAEDIPPDFPLDTVEATDDYGFVRLSSASEEYLLPTHAENLSCERGTTICSRNGIDFRNYHKYSGEAVITFDKEE